MFGFLKKLWRDRRGNALVIIGAALPLIVGSAGLASDTIQWTLWKRQLQRTADSAAMAGVYAEVLGNSIGTCSSTNIPTAAWTDPVAYDIRKNNHTTMTPECSVGHPTTGTFASDAMAVKVDLSVQRQLSFSSMFMSAAPTIRASATATIVPGGDYCAFAKIATATTGITAGGSAVVNLRCGMITNSTSMDAAIAFGSSTVTASPVAAVGGIDANDNWGSGTVLQPFTLPQADPFENVYPPTPSGCQSFSAWDTNNNNNPNGTLDLTGPSSPISAGGTYCIKENNGTLSIQGNVTLPSATYVLDATSLRMTNTGASITCHQCTFVLTSSTAATNPSSIGNVSLQGGKVDLTAAETGAFAGIMIYQDRRAPSCTSNCNLVNGNSSSVLQGALYFPNQGLTFTGNTGMTSNCLQMVALTLTFTGNSAVDNNCPAGSASHSFTGRKVRLVA